MDSCTQQTSRSPKTDKIKLMIPDVSPTSNINAPADQWFADSMRVSLFVSHEPTWPAALLTYFLGIEADTEQTSRVGNVSTKLEAARVNDYQINAVTHASRLDIHVSVAQKAGETDDTVRPAVSFRPLLDKIALTTSELGAFARLAVGASLIKKCGDKTEVYDLISKKFPCLALDPENSDDFVLQMNHFIADEAARINRIERWAYGVFDRIDIPLMGAAQGMGLMTNRFEGMKLDLDFNTALPALGDLKGATAKRVMQRLIETMFEKIEVA